MRQNVSISLPDGWKISKLGDCATFINGRAYDQHELLEAGTPVLRIQNLNGGSKWFYSDIDLPDNKYCVAGDLLFAWSASFGPYIWSGEKSIFHYHIWKIIPQQNLDKNFAFYLLSSITQKLKASARGIAMLHLTKSGIEAWKIALPPLDEQRRIAAILDHANALRRMRQDTTAILNGLVPALFDDMFGEKRALKSSELRPLGEFVEFVTSGGRGWAKYYSDSGARFIRSFDVQMNYIGDEDACFVDPPDNAEAKRTRIKTGDILLTITGSRIGRVAVAPRELEGAFISQHVSIIRVDQNKMLPDFVSFFLSLENGGQRQIAKAQRGQSKPGLNFDQIRELTIPIFDIKLQRSFQDKMRAAKKVVSAQNAHLSDLNHLFASLQHRAFRGEL